MTVPISPIDPLATGPAALAPAGTGNRTEGAGTAFASSFASALDDLDAADKATDELARAAATGDLRSVEDLMIASTETQLATQLTVAVRNRALESFNEIMRMQL